MGEFIAGDIFKGIRDQLEEEFGDVGVQIGRNLEQGLQRGDIGLAGLDARLKNIRPDVARATEEVRRFREEQDKNGGSLGRLSKTIDEFGDSVGRAFGKGSRNNFVNFFGSLVGNIASLPGRFVDAAASVQDFFNKVSKAGEEIGGAAGWVKGLVATVAEMAPAIAGGVLALAALVFAIGTLTAALSLAAGVLTALISSLAFGLVGALAPLAGLLAPVALGVGALVGGLASLDKEARKKALKPFIDGLKEVGKRAAPGVLDGLTRAFDRLSKPQGEGTIKLWERVLHLSTAAGVAVGKFFDNFAIGIRGPGLGNFITMMQKTMPDTLAKLGRIFGNTLEGILSIFTVLNEPGGVVNQFVDWLNEITKSFAAWSGSDKGRQDLNSFFDKAVDSAKVLGGFLKTVSDLLFTILDAGRQPGNSLFADMTTAVQGWVDSIKANPNILNDWFASAQEFGAQIGGVALAFADLFDALDNPSTRSAAINTFKALATVLESVAGFLGLFNDKLVLVGGTIAAAVIAWPILTKTIQGIGTAFSTTFGSGMDKSVGKMTRFQASLKNLAGPAGVGLLVTGLSDAQSHGTTFANVMQNTVGGALTGFAVGGPVGALVGGAAGGGLTALIGAFHHTSDAAKQTDSQLKKSAGFAAAAEAADQLSGSLLGAANSYGEVSRKAVAAQFSDSSGKMAADIATLRGVGVSLDTITSAALGNKDALRLVNEAFNTAIKPMAATVKSTKAAWDEAKDGVISYRNEQGVLVSQHLSTDAVNNYKNAWLDARDKFRGAKAEQETFQKRVEDNTGVIKDHAKAIQDLATKLHITVAAYKDLPKAARTNIEANGLPETFAGVKRLVDQYKGLQNFKAIKALISAPGVEPTRKQIIDLGQQYKLTPKQVKTLIQLEGLPAVNSGLDGAQGKMDKLGNSVATPKVVLDDAAYLQSIAQAELARARLDGSTATVHLRTTGTQNVTASGGIFFGAQSRIIGEAGPEAVVPLNRPLFMVDPAVRALSAIAQGLRAVPGQQVGPAGKVVNVGGITVVTPTVDPGAVAQETINRLVAVGY
jgi:hypothetical protein